MTRIVFCACCFLFSLTVFYATMMTGSDSFWGSIAATFVCGLSLMDSVSKFERTRL